MRASGGAVKEAASTLLCGRTPVGVGEFYLDVFSAVVVGGGRGVVVVVVVVLARVLYFFLVRVVLVPPRYIY